MDRLEPADRRAVESEAVGKAVLGELADGHREVLHEAREIAEAEINNFDSTVLGEREDVFGRFCHVHLLSKRPGTPESQGSGRWQDYVPTSFVAMAGLAGAGRAAHAPDGARRPRLRTWRLVQRCISGG